LHGLFCYSLFFCFAIRSLPMFTLFPYTTLFRSKVLLSASFATLHNLYRDYNRLFLSLFFPHNCIIDSLSQSFLVELLPYLMQLLFDSLKFLAINFSVACICSLCQLIDV